MLRSTRHVSLLLGALLVLPILRVVPAGASTGAAATVAPLHVTLTFSPEQFRYARIGDQLRITGEGLDGRDVGGSVWPEAVVWLAIPADAVPVGVTATGDAPVVVARTAEIGGPARAALKLDASLPRAGEPLQPVRFDGFARGTHLLSLRVSPLAIDDATGEIVLHRRLDLTVMLAPDATVPDHLVPERKGSRGDQDFRATLRTLVRNPSAIVEPAAAPSPPPQRESLVPMSFAGQPWSDRFRPTVDGHDVDMVIVTNEALAGEYQRLADWRSRSGTYAVIRTTEWITSAYPEGVDLPDRIRRFLADAVRLWGVEWVLLGGDSDVVPVRLGITQYYGGEEIPTDLYYQCLDRSWNENGNDRFGEGAPPDLQTPPDNVDLLPEVWLGRIPISSASGTHAMIDKIFQYERTPESVTGHLDHFTALGEVLEPSNWNYPDTVVFDGALLCEEAIARLTPAMQVTRYYENWRDWQSVGAIPETKEAVIQGLNDGPAIVYHAGHGFHNNLSVGLGGMELFKEDVDALTNAGHPFFFFGINCNSAAIDFDCIAEHFLNQAEGAVGYIGSTRFDFPDLGDSYQEEFFKEIMKGTPVGKAHAVAKYPKLGLSFADGPARWHQMSLACLGDPLVRIPSGIQRPLTVTNAATLTLGESLPVSVLRDGVPVVNARVTLFKEGDCYASDTTDASGNVTIPVTSESAGTASLVVTARNSVPHESTVTLGLPVVAPWPALLSLRVDDAGGGNGNGRLEAGESADLYLKIRNDGGAPAPNLTATLTLPAPGTVVTPSAVLGTLAGGVTDSTWEGSALRVSIGEVSDYADIRGTLVLSWTGGSRTLPIDLRAGGTNLVVLSQTWLDDPGGPGADGVVAPNELVQIFPVIGNRGGALAGSIKARLESSDPRVTLETSMATCVNLEPGASAGLSVPLSFRVSEVEAIGAIDLVIEADAKQSSRRTVDLVPPTAPGTVIGVGRPSSIRLSWTHVDASDLRGYRIERSASEGGPFTVLNEFVDNPMGVYEDVGLAPFSRWYYRIAAMDQSGNLSAFSSPVNLSTSFPALDNWPIGRSGTSPSSPVVHDFDGDGVLEVVIGGEEIFAVRADGTEYRNGDDDSRTLGVLTRTGSALFWTTPAVADIDNDGILDIVAAGFVDGKLYVFGSDGAVKPGWPRAIGNPLNQAGAATPWGSPLVTDVDGDGKKEIYITGDHWLYAFHSDGTEVKDGDNNAATTGPLLDLTIPYNYGTPAAADFDNDGHPDIVVGSRGGKIYLLHGDGTLFPGFPKEFGGGAQITGSPAIADLDQDGELEMIFPVRTALEVHAMNRFGVEPPGWPARIQINQDFDASPTVARLDGDAFPDVVMAGGSGRVSVWHGQNGTLFPGFPVDLTALEQATSFAVRGTPCLGDVTGDGNPDIVVGTQTGTIYGLSLTGQLLPGFPLRAEDSVEGGTLLWDIDGDGHTNIVFGSVDKRVYAYDTPGVFNPTSCPWPMFRHDQSNTGYVATPLTTPVEPTLARFTATVGEGSVELAWRAADGDWSGWLVDRARATTPESWTRRTTAPLGGGAGEHRFTDHDLAPGDRWLYRLTGIDRAGGTTAFAPLLVEIPAEAPRVFAGSATPNPFQSATTISYTLPGEAEISLDIFDVQGKRIRRLDSGVRPAGTAELSWDGRDDSGGAVEAGVYFWRLTAGGETITRKLTRVTR